MDKCIIFEDSHSGYISAINSKPYKICMYYNGTNHFVKKLDNYMKSKIIQINVDLGIGKFKRTVYASDLTYEYDRINGDYRS